MRGGRALGAAVVLVPAVAMADPPPPPEKASLQEHTLVSIPFLFGVDAALVSPETSTGFVFGWRPEVIFAWRSDRSLAFGVGPYAEAVGSFGTHQIWFGGGGTIVGYFGSLGVALSGGLDVDFLHAEGSASPVVGLFVGYRTQDLDGIDLPLGVRVDFRPALGPLPTTVIVSAQVDVVILAVVGFFGAVMRGIN